jgi:hypothetical protein
MLEMAKEKKTFQFLFSTEDLDFDPKRVEVVDSKTGEKLKIHSAIKIVNKDKVKIFAVRMTEGQIEKIHRTAGKVDQTPADFGRQAMDKAIKEVEEDSKRIRKNKR